MPTLEDFMDARYRGKTYDAHKTVDELPKTISYCSNSNAYRLRDNLEKLCITIGNAEDFYRFRAGERKHIFPDYDPKIHEIESYYDHRVKEFLDYGIPFTVEKKVETKTTMPHGQYKIEYSENYGTLFKKIEVDTDSYISLNRKAGSVIYNDLQTFVQNKEAYVKEKVRHRKGTLLYGPPGNGKTREIEQIFQNSHKDKIYSFFVPSNYRSLGRLDCFKSILKGETVVFILEEITERVDGSNVEEFLSFLDGETSWNNCYIIATTNYPEELPYNVIDRPGRFGSIIEFKNPTIEERKLYLLGRGYNDEEANRIVDLTDGLSLDYLVQSVTQSRINNITIEQYLKESKETRDKVSKSFKNSIGI